MEISVFGQVNHTPTDSGFQNFTLHPSSKVALLAKVVHDGNYPWISWESLIYLSLHYSTEVCQSIFAFFFSPFHFSIMGKFSTFLRR